MRLNYTSLNRSPTSLSYLLSSGFKPASLFAQSEPGVWLDPSDVADLAWRRNLLTYSEQFDNAAWTKANVTVTANAAVAPDGTMTADKIVEDSATAVHYLGSPSITVGNTPYTTSVYAKAAERTWCVLRFGYQNIGGIWVNLTTGQKGQDQSGGVTSFSIVDAGNGWWRISITDTPASGNFGIGIDLASADGVSSYTGNSTSGIYIWGAQLELGSTATPYQRISDVTTEVLERFPTTTLFQDTAGTTPVTTPGQPVGLVLDKSKGLVLGPELVTNGDFSSGSTGWSVNGGWSISGGAANAAIASGFGDVRGNSNLTTIGRTYRLTFTLNVVSGGVRWYLGGVTASTTITSSGTYSVLVLATDVQYVAFIAYGSGGAFTGSVDNISVREIPGNHATQATSASRPTYGIEPLGGRRNLLTRTEEFDNAAWTKALTVASGVLDPLGGSTAFTLTAPIVGAEAYQTFTGRTIGQANTAQCWMRRRTGSGGIQLYANSTRTTVTLTSSWQLITLTQNASATTIYFGIRVSEIGDAVDVWHPQFELGSTATAYQRVGTAFDVTEAGVASVSYLSFDGVDDWLVTPTIDPAASAGPGAELVTNGTFASDTNWTKETGWAISGGVASKTSGTAGSLYQGAAAMVQGRTYQIDFTVSGYSAGTLTPFCRGTGGTGVTANGTYSQRIIAGADSVYVINFFAGATFVGSIDNISVREIVSDKVQVFAGVRKLSDTVSIVAELSQDINSNNGSFLFVSGTNNVTGFEFTSRGSAAPSLGTTGRFAVSAPVTVIATGIADISAPLSRVRVNGVVGTDGTSTQGTGNYLAYPLYIGRRAGTSLPFNGQIYSLIVRFGANLATDQIASIESSVGSKTGFFAPTITGVPTIGVS